jgi:hypothetical protein
MRCWLNLERYERLIVLALTRAVEQAGLKQPDRGSAGGAVAAAIVVAAAAAATAVAHQAWSPRRKQQRIGCNNDAAGLPIRRARQPQQSGKAPQLKAAPVKCQPPEQRGCPGAAAQRCHLQVRQGRLQQQVQGGVTLDRGRRAWEGRGDVGMQSSNSSRCRCSRSSSTELQQSRKLYS